MPNVMALLNPLCPPLMTAGLPIMTCCVQEGALQIEGQLKSSIPWIWCECSTLSLPVHKANTNTMAGALANSCRKAHDGP